MTTVILAEKPSQALAYAQAFQNYKKEDGYFTVKDSLFSDETFITFGFGHLVELAPPSFYNEKWGKWSLESLPIFPSNYSFEVSKDKQKQFKIVSKLLNKANTIIIATDSDREGSNIAWSIIHKANSYDNTKSFKRLWINSLEKEAIREGFKNLKNGEEDIPAYLEAQTRQISDWLIGMNGSPLYTLNLQGKGVNGTFTLGRVQTPTLYMIYQRQQEIENFKKIPYFEIDNTVSNGSDSFKANLVPLKKFESKEEADRFLDENKAKLGDQKGVISNVEVKQKSSNSPTLFSLSSLQSKINSLYKASASDTLKAVQKLYEAKLLTYPRTDTHFITDNEFAYLQENINKYRQFLNIKEEAMQLTPRKRYVDNNKVQ
ncbi:TPA: DNA topoisomerase III, partial [Enterococcus faecium]|nr:DNA topoisomerase III [Enterococcus faecium]